MIKAENYTLQKCNIPISLATTLILINAIVFLNDSAGSAQVQTI